MNENKNFYTLKGYALNSKEQLSTAMEDYLEMIYRISQNQDIVRIKDLAENIHVKPSSASKMVSNLKDAGYVKFEKYGYIELTQKGIETSAYLLYRHDVIHAFLCKLNESENELEQVEKIEHFLNKKTVLNLEKLTQYL